jgi:hypothetical protein
MRGGKTTLHFDGEFPSADVLVGVSMHRVEVRLVRPPGDQVVADTQGLGTCNTKEDL